MLINEQPLQDQMAPQQAPMPGQPGGPMGNQEVIQQSPIEGMMNPGVMGGQAEANEMVGNQPSVDADLLPNPNLEPRAK
jgi:hypothetical protein